MKTIRVPWGAWYAERQLALSFPAAWEVHTAALPEAPPLSAADVARAFAAPTGSAPLHMIASGRRDAVIAVDDITRPTPSGELLGPVLDELARGGITRQRVRVVIASGAHRPAIRQDVERKLGRRLAQSLDVVVHNPYEGLAFVGRSRAGIPIYANRAYLEGDLKIAIGGITPHESAGFGGGRKLIAVGLAGLETLCAFHSLDGPPAAHIGCIEGNAQHANLVEIARAIGLDFIVNAVFNANREVAGLVCGEPSAAHAAGVALARTLYACPAPPGADVVVLNAYPKDTDLLQACMALNVAWTSAPWMVRPGGTIVITAACPEGAGVHFLAGYGMRAPFAWTEEALKGHALMVVSPHVSQHELARHFPASAVRYSRWGDAVRALIRRHGWHVRAVVYPNAPLQLPVARG